MLRIGTDDMACGSLVHRQTDCDCDVQGDMDPEYRRLNRERSAQAAAKTRTMQVIADPRGGPVRAAAVGQRISFSNKARPPTSVKLSPDV